MGIGDIIRRLLAKLVLKVAGAAATEACRNLQLCAGLHAGIEGAIHAVRELSEESGLRGAGDGDNAVPPPETQAEQRTGRPMTEDDAMAEEKEEEEEEEEEEADGLLAKLVLKVAGAAATEACGNLQLCAGLQAGIEGAIHAVRELSEESGLRGAGDGDNAMPPPETQAEQRTGKPMMEDDAMAEEKEEEEEEE